MISDSIQSEVFTKPGNVEILGAFRSMCANGFDSISGIRLSVLESKIKDLMLYEAAIAAISAQFVCPRTTAERQRDSILGGLTPQDRDEIRLTELVPVERMYKLEEIYHKLLKLEQESGLVHLSIAIKGGTVSMYVGPAEDEPREA